ncbi:hypothetical protein N431DRAFT_224736 [Stipitochalara longipes BDJ]|nr:hypothetical protein N431DRAFT_224736 [Stipitochalara longipes BDJ]
MAYNLEEHGVSDFDQPAFHLPALLQGREFSALIHGNIYQTGQGIYCQQCNLQFPTHEVLASHGREAQHAPYRCWCGTTFARRDILRRHIQTFQPEVVFPCPHCEKRPRAFKRLDHLTQHFRGYHKMDSGGGS